jgi:hypothetical protein
MNHGGDRMAGLLPISLNAPPKGLVIERLGKGNEKIAKRLSPSAEILSWEGCGGL